MSVATFFGRLFSSPKLVEDTARSAIKGLDDIVYTEQERAEKTQLAQDLYAKLWSAAVPSAISRRLIAVCLVFVYSLIAVTAIALYAFGLVDAAMFSLKTLLELFLQPVNIVVGFYFLKQVVTEYTKKS